ncbi:unnamed protein product, partial [marine sediment metagenome]
MKNRIVVLTKFNSNSSWLISHLLTRGVNIAGIAFLEEQQAKQSKRIVLARYLERFFLRVLHRLVHKAHPFTYSDYVCQYDNNLLQELRKSKVPYCFVKTHNGPKAEHILKQWQPDILLLY